MSNKPELNDQQKKAVKPDLHLPAVVTAAAGSGKTSVLVERVIGLICDRSLNISIDSLAIMTFTRNAARSMRRKLNKALDEKLDELDKKILDLKADPSAPSKEKLEELENDHAYLKEQKFRMRRTIITTIDAFCLNMIKENIELFDLPVNFTLADNARMAAFQLRAITLAMEDFYNESGSFTEEERNTLFYTFNFSSDQTLQNTVIDFGNDLSTYVDADEWLDKAQNLYTDEKLLEAQYIDALATYLDAYFCRSSDPNGRKGLVQKYLENFIITLAAVYDEGKEKLEDLEAERAEREAEGKSTKAVDDKIVSAKFLVEEYIPNLRKSLKAEKEKYELVYKAYEDFKPNKTIASLYDVCEAIKNVPEPPTLSQSGSKTASRPLIKITRDYGSAIYEKLNRFCFSKDNLENQQLAVKTLIKLEKLYMGYYQDLKRDNSCIDFSDCELMLLNKLKEEKNEEFRRSLRERFKYVIVDEFQDSNDIQAELFKLICGDKLFYVGDIKQSIYAFRGGNPGIMARLIDREDGFEPVPLSTNYRSRKTVLDVVNNAFSGLMTKEYGNVEYSDKDNRLEFGAKFLYKTDPKDELPDDFVPVDTDKYCAEIHFVSGDNVSKENKAMRQPRYAAKQIKAILDDPEFLITKENPVTKEKERVRPSYSDFFILVRKNSKIPKYRKALSELGIPSATTKGKDFLESEEIELLLDLLSVIDNPLKDEDMLKVLMSPIFRFSAEEVTDIRLGLMGIDQTVLSEDKDLKKRLASYYRNRSLYKCLKDCSEDSTKICLDKETNETLTLERHVPEKLTRFMSALKDFRYYKSSNSLHKLISRIYEDTDAELIAAVFDDSAQRVANVRQLCNMAADFEERSGGSLGDFLRFIERIKSNDKQKVEDASPSNDRMNAVQIMTYHASKGLEAPVCILCELNEGIAKYDYTGAFLNSRENYLALQDVDYKNRVKSNSFAHSALSVINRKALCGEELRVLYVALTRAQEKLIMITEKKYSEVFPNVPSPLTVLDPQNPLATFNSNIAFDWVLESLKRYPITDGRFEDFNCVLVNDKDDDGAPPKKDEDSASENTEDSKQKFTPPAERIRALVGSINFKYAHTEDTERQEKYTVTELAHRHSDTPINLLAPDFAEKTSGADIGNAYHNCMQYISFENFEKAKDGDFVKIAKTEIEHLASHKRLSEREVKCIKPQKIADFFTGELGKRALAAEKVLREEPFLAEVTGAEIGEDLADIMLQGRIDMYFVENGEIVVVDYKTDSKENLENEKDNYAKQVMIYSTVLSKLKGMKVKEVYLYSFTDGKAIKI